MIKDVPFSVKKWDLSFVFDRVGFKSINSSVKLPTALWNWKGLSGIRTKSLTKEAKKVDYAKVCLDLNPNGPFPLFLSSIKSFGEIFNVKVVMRSKKHAKVVV